MFRNGVAFFSLLVLAGCGTAGDEAPIIVGCHEIQYRGYVFTESQCDRGYGTYEWFTTEGPGATLEVTCSGGCISAVSVPGPYIPPPEPEPDWTAMEVPETGNSYYAVWGSGPDNVYAAGSYGALLRYDGTTWTRVDCGVDASLDGIWGAGANDVFVVGTGATIIHYDGATWTRMDTGEPETVLFQAVWGNAPNDVNVVGAYGKVLHYDGSTWSVLGSLPETFYGLDVWSSSPNDVFVVDLSGGVHHYDGSTWSQVSLPAKTDEDINIRAVYGTAANDVFVAGASDQGWYEKAVVFHYDGTSWKLLEDFTYSAGGFTDVWASGPDNVFAVGTNSQIYHYDGSEWSETVSDTNKTFGALWGSNPSDVFFVGPDDQVLHYSPASD